MGPIDTLVQKFKLVKAGKNVRRLFKEGIVDADGVATSLGRKLARRLMAEEYITENVDTIAKQLVAFSKVSKDESEDED